MDQLRREIEAFFAPHTPLRKPLLLGFSGGEDSLALATCLRDLEIPFHLAHFDHGWREESLEEAAQLQEWAEERGIPFHTARSSSPKKDELWAREERYAFFSRLFSEKAFAALVLAHHQNDQAETVLKRIFEGAHLTSLKGMEPISYRGDLPIWRPFLSISKEKILAYLEGQGLKPLDDATNRDLKYLRARMREKIIPRLSTHFGKEIREPLARLGEEAAELDAYFKKKTEKLNRGRIEGPFGVLWDFSSFLPLDPIEIRYALRPFFGSRAILDQLTDWIISKAPNKKLSSGGVVVDRSVLFFIEKPLPKFPEKVPLHSGTHSYGEWEWVVEWEESTELRAPNWRDWWQGKISMSLPAGDYALGPAIGTFRKKWNGDKVPAFLRESLPLVLEDGEPVAEFLAGHKTTKESDFSCQATISIKNKNVYPENF